MTEENLKYKMPISHTYQNPNNFHFSSYIQDKPANKTLNYKDYNTSREDEQEYQLMANINKNKGKSIINLTSEDLKKEYSDKYNYYNNGLNYIFILSVFLIICIFIEFKYLGPLEPNIIILVMSFISAGFCFLQLINLRGKALIDTYVYVTFYICSMIESILFFSIFIFKLINFILIYKSINSGACSKKYRCPGYFIYLFILILNLIIFFGISLCIKFIFVLFLDGFKILFMKEKTIFQKQIEINEKKDKNDKKVFNEEYESLNHLKSKDELKDE